MEPGAAPKPAGLPGTQQSLPVNEAPCRLPKLVHLGSFLLGQDLGVQGKGWWAGKFTLLFVLPRLQSVLKGLRHENPESDFSYVSEGEHTPAYHTHSKGSAR